MFMCNSSTSSYFRNRRTVRNFQNRKVSAGLLNMILDESMHAPTTGNMQLYSVVVTCEENRRKELAKFHFNQPASVSAPVLLTVCADFNRFAKWCRVSGANHEFNNLQGLMMGLMDALIYAQQIVTISELNGLSTCYLGTTIYNAPEISQLLSLPAGVIPVVTVALGYATEMPDDSGRLPLEAIISEELYRNFTDEEVADLYAEKEAREDSRKFVAENNKKSLAQVFTDVRYPGSVLEPFSAKLHDYLTEQGFII